MTSNTPRLPRLVVLSPVILAVFTTSSVAQQFAPVVDDRYDTSVMPAQAPVVEEQKKRALEMGVILSAAYDDNIYFSKERPKSDAIYRISPAIAYTYGKNDGAQGGFLKFAYRPTLVTYAKASSEDRVDQQAAITTGWSGKFSKIVYDGSIQKLGDPTADAGRPTDRLVTRNEIRAGWQTSEKVTLELSAGERSYDYSDPEFFDSQRIYGELAARYAYSPKTEIALAYQGGTLSVDGTDAQMTHQVTTRLIWKPRDKIQVNLEAGAEHRTTENGTDINPVVEGRMEWKPREGTSVYLSGYRREESSAYLAGQNYSVTGGGIGLSQKLSQKWTAKVEAGRERSSYSQVAGVGRGGRKDKFWFVRPALQYQANDDLGFSLFYSISDNSSSFPDFGYDQNVAGIEMNYRF